MFHWRWIWALAHHGFAAQETIVARCCVVQVLATTAFAGKATDNGCSVCSALVLWHGGESLKLLVRIAEQLRMCVDSHRGSVIPHACACT